MRTTIDLPDSLFRQAKAAAALRGTSMKELIAIALERELQTQKQGRSPSKARVKLPVVRLSPGRKLDLTGVDLDDIPA